MQLLAALDDPKLFAPFFPSPAWDRWRTFLRVLTGQPLSGDELAVFTQATGRTTAPTVPAAEAWVVCGRRAGKSRVASVVAAYTAALADLSKLAPGETGVVLCCAVDKAQAGVILGYIRALFSDVPLLRSLVSNETAESIELRRRVRIEVKSSNYRAVRGVTLLAAVLDECAFLRDEASALPDVELYRALKPALATTGGLMLGLSSPWARRGLLWTKYRKHWAQDGSVLVWQAPSTTMHPGLDAELIAEAREDDPEAAAAEWDACFRADLESYCSADVLDACTANGVTERPPIDGVAYVGFLDAAAGSGRDSFTACVAHAELRGSGPPFVLVDAVREWRPPFDPLAVAEEAATFLRGYRIEVAQSDGYAGAWVSEAIARHGVHVLQDAEPRSSLYLAALPLLTGRQCELLDLPRMRTQFAQLERRRRAGGRDVVDHPPGGHDDLCNAVAGAMVRAVAFADEGRALPELVRHHGTDDATETMREHLATLPSWVAHGDPP
ncbi:MAG: hypothetical protein KIT14_13980 [bacterium]|nr:hypothetical protein [bacterium]MCW5891641.1 hypothetical protein [bacterium]